MNQQAKSDVILALDFSYGERDLRLSAMFPAEKPFVKIGMELYYAEGPEIVVSESRGHKIFLDLKLHDIPNTVSAPCMCFPRWMWTW
jgi:orotidine-5'-phosphate decarboxylase